MIYKEIDIKKPLYIATLDNGVTLHVYDGYGTGSDGRVYYPMVKELPDDECEVVGWCVNGCVKNSESPADRG